MNIVWPHFQNPLALQLAEALLHFLWQGVAWATLLWWWLQVFGHRGAAHRHLACLIVLAGMFASPFVTFWVIPTPAAVSILDPTPAPRVRAAPTGERTSLDLPSAPVTGENLGNLLAENALWLEPITDERTAKERMLDLLHFVRPYVVLIWCVGVFVFAVRLSAGYAGTLTLRMGRLPVDRETAVLARQLGTRLALRREVGVFISGRVVEATVVGFLRPIVLLPMSWLSELPPDVLEAVLAHELAHVRRHDLWINLAQRLVETLLFFHPCVWWVSERVRLEREMCCDDLAVAVTGRPGVYAETLELVARRRRSAQAPFLATAFGGKRMSLLRRVRNVLGQEPPQGGRWWPVGILALLLVSGFAAATVDTNSKLWAQDDAPDNEKALRADKRRDARQSRQLQELTEVVRKLQEELASLKGKGAGKTDEFNAAARQRQIYRQQLQLAQNSDSEKAWAKEREGLMAHIRELEDRLSALSEERERPRAERERARAERERENARRRRAEAIEQQERERRVKARKEKLEGGEKDPGPRQEALRRVQERLQEAQKDQQAKSDKLRAEREEITRQFQDAMKQFHKEMESHQKMLGKQRQGVMRDLHIAARELAEQARQKHQALGKEQRAAVEQLRQAIREGGDKEALTAKREAIQRQFHEAAEQLREATESQRSQLQEKQEAVAREFEEAARRFEEEMRAKRDHMRKEHHRALEKLQQAIEEQHRAAAESPLDRVEGVEALLGGKGVDVESLEALLAESAEVREEALHAAMEVQDEIAVLAGEHAAEVEELARLASEGAVVEVEEALHELGESRQEIEEEVRLAEEETMLELEQAQHELDEELQAAEEEALLVEEEVQREAEEAAREAAQAALGAEEEARRATEEEQQEIAEEPEKEEEVDEDADDEDESEDDGDPAERALRALEERLRALERELELRAPRVEGQFTEGVEGLLDEIRVRLERTSEDADDDEVEVEVELEEIVTDKAAEEAEDDEVDDEDDDNVDDDDDHEEEAEVEEEHAALGYYLRLLAGADGASTHPIGAHLGNLLEKIGLVSDREESNSR